MAPDAGALSRFLGLVEGRLRAPIPDDWARSVLAAQMTTQGRIAFPLTEGMETSFAAGRPRREGEFYIVEKGGVSVRVPADDGYGAVDGSATGVDGDVVFVALTGWGRSPYPLYALDRTTQKVLWSSRVWAVGNWLNYQGQGDHFAQISAAGESVAVFGVSTEGVYAELFDKKTGRNRCRFGTAYFDVTPTTQPDLTRLLHVGMTRDQTYRALALAYEPIGVGGLLDSHVLVRSPLFPGEEIQLNFLADDHDRFVLESWRVASWLPDW